MKPTKKSPKIDKMLKNIFGKSREDCIHNGRCMTCDVDNIDVGDFRDNLSLKEYTISGLCQKCQDKVFG